MAGGYALQYPPGDTRAQFEAAIEGLKTEQAGQLISAIEGLADDPRPSDPKLHYLEIQAEKTIALLQKLEGTPFKKKALPGMIENLKGTHRITAGGQVVVYDIDDRRKVVWLLAIRPA